MKLHPAIDPECGVNEVAKLVGFDKVDFDRPYTITKIECKNPSPNGIPDQGYITRGHPFLVGNEKQVALYFMDYFGYFKTSVVLSVVEVVNGYRIETRNSVYFMEKA